MQSVTLENTLNFGPEITWPKEFPELKIIDDALRCGICYDYMKTCMVTPCAHSYCSICIRKYLTYKTACPTCFEETFETNLRNNRILDRVTELFSHIRDKLIKHLKIAAIHFNCSEKNQSPLPSQNQTSQKANNPDVTPKNSSKNFSKQSSTKGKLNFTSVYSPSTSSMKSEISKRLEDVLGSPVTNGPKNSEFDCSLPADEDPKELKIPMVPSMFLQPKVETQPKTVDVPLVSCPVCGVDIPERNINAHLDNCLANVDKPPVKSPVKSKTKRTPLPKMVWHMMAEKDLRKKLKDYGLNTQGDKKALTSRIQRYITLYNSECDSDNPRPIADLIRQVEREEKQMPAQNQPRLVINKKTDPKIIEEENNKYIQENKDSFKKLIEAMRDREGRNIKPLRPINRLSSDDEDDDEKRLQKNLDAQKTPGSLNVVEETVNLCDSNDDRSSSPVLGSWVNERRQISNASSDSSQQSDIFLSQNRKPERNQEMPKRKEDLCSDTVQRNEGEQNSNHVESDIQGDFCVSPEELFRSSPTRPPSPSCIIANHSDSGSEDSISILINNIDDQFLENTEEPVTENLNGESSQLVDPDFVLDTEEQEVNGDCSEEEFLPRRKSKRKLKNSVNNDSNEIPSPRRTRRRLNK